MITLVRLIFLILVIITILYFAVLAISGASDNESERLKHVKDSFTFGEVEEELSFTDRLIKPVYNKILNFFTRFTPSNIQDEYEKLLTDAGMQRSYTPIRLITNQVLFFLIVIVLVPFIMKRLTGEINITLLALIVIGSVYLPIYHLRSRAKKRKEKIQRDLPNVLDMVYISVEAGLSFDAAMATTASRMHGELNDEIMRAMDEINRGRARESALYSIADRTGVDDVRSFMATIIQSEKLGSNIANVLRIQADVIRDKRKQSAEERINKMSIKMLLPLVFLLLPALFVVIMGPSLVNIMNSTF